MDVKIKRLENGYTLEIVGKIYGFEDTRSQEGARKLGEVITEILKGIYKKPKPILVQATSGIEIGESVVKSTPKFKVGQVWADNAGGVHTLFKTLGSTKYPIQSNDGHVYTEKGWFWSDAPSSYDLVTLVKDVD